MIAKDFPCKTCRHAAIKHYSNIAIDQTICTGCVENDYINTGEQIHPFVGDNLRYMELQVRKEEIRNEH